MKKESESFPYFLESDRSHSGRRQKGQAMVETVLIFPVLLLLIFGIMQLAMIGYAMIILNDAAHAAARAAAVGRSANLAAIYVISKTLGVSSKQGTFSGVSVSTKKLSSKNHTPPLFVPAGSLFSSGKGVVAVTATVNYLYKPMYSKVFAPSLGVIPLRVSARIMREPDTP